jgi:hypothetical protein
MARKDALLRLHDQLLAQRDDLRRKLAGELEEASQVGNGSTDLVDAVYDDQERELHSQLVSLEGRELERIEKAIRQVRTLPEPQSGREIETAPLCVLLHSLPGARGIEASTGCGSGSRLGIGR